MKKIILTGTIVLASILSISSANADCMYQETAAQCSISGQTYTSSCAGWSDTSSWSIPVAYQWECQNKATLNDTMQNAIWDILYKYLDKKEYISSQTNEYYSITREWQKYIQNQLFPAIQKLITQEIKKTSPNHKKIAIYNHLVSLVGYDYYMKK